MEGIYTVEFPFLRMLRIIQMYFLKTMLYTSMLFVLLSMVACGKADSDKNEGGGVNIEREQAESSSVSVDIKLEELSGSQTEKSTEVSLVVSADIMRMMNGTDPCFVPVELVRDEGDLATYRAQGDKIILKKKEVETHTHRTYMDIIGRMIKEKKSIPEIRQAVLNTCRRVTKKRGG